MGTDESSFPEFVELVELACGMCAGTKGGDDEVAEDGGGGIFGERGLVVDEVAS